MAYLRGKLLEKRRLLLERMQVGLAEADEPAGLPGDPVDMAHSTSAREISYEIGAVESDAVAQIDHVLQKIESGKYGICEDCGKRIPEARLKAVPFAYLCVECKQRDERTVPEGEPAEWPDLGGFDEGEADDLEGAYGTLRARRPA